MAMSWISGQWSPLKERWANKNDLCQKRIGRQILVIILKNAKKSAKSLRSQRVQCLLLKRWRMYFPGVGWVNYKLSLGLGQLWLPLWEKAFHCLVCFTSSEIGSTFALVIGDNLPSCQVRNISHKVEEKEEVVMGEAVGLDLYSSFQQQEFTDFEIVCEDRNLQCHKVVLAARSPVFRWVRSTWIQLWELLCLAGQCCWIIWRRARAQELSQKSSTPRLCPCSSSSSIQEP